MNKLISIIMLISLSISQDSECISKAGLEALGFIDVLETPVANEGDNKRCSSFEKVCISPDSIDTQIKDALKLFTSGVKSQLGSLKGASKFLNKGLFKLKDAFTNEKKKARLTEKLGTDDTATVEALFEKCNETECTIVDLTNLENNKECRKAIATTMSKGLCLLLSDQGKANANISDDGTIESLAISSSEMETVFTSCVSYYAPLCEITNLFGIYEKLAKGNRVKHGDRGDKLVETCGRVLELNNCIDTPDSCNETLKIEFFESFVSLGKDTVPGPDSENIDSQESNVTESEKDIDEESDNKTEETTQGNTNETADSGSRLLTARMLSEASSTCSFDITSNGYDLSGVESGVEVDEFAETTSILKFVIFSIILMLLK